MPCPEPGQLLSADEVITALGASIRPPTWVLPGPAPSGTRMCVWRAAGGGASLTLTTITGPLAAHTVRVERRLGQPVPGLGDECYLRGGRVCVVRRGDRVLKLVLSGSRARDPAAAVVLLARLAAGRLEQAAGRRRPPAPERPASPTAPEQPP